MYLALKRYNIFVVVLLPQVINIIKQKRKTHQYVIIDTPGQIEVFMWSASGSIITESLAALFPTVMIYVTDLISNVNPITFISNMTYACSILYKTKLPLVVTLNKVELLLLLALMAFTS